MGCMRRMGRGAGPPQKLSAPLPSLFLRSPRPPLNTGRMAQQGAATPAHYGAFLLQKEAARKAAAAAVAAERQGPARAASQPTARASQVLRRRRTACFKPPARPLSCRKAPSLPQPSP